jgi:hypothetical protein
MVEAEQVQHAMQHEDLDLVFNVVAEFARLRPGPAERNGQIAQVERGPAGGERKHVGGVIQAAEFAIQAAQFGIAGDEAIEGLPVGDFFLQDAGEILHGAAAEIGWRAAENYGTAVG